MSTVICPNCGHQNDDTDKFCGGCATPLGARAVDTSAPTAAPKKAPKKSSPKGVLFLVIAMAILPLGIMALSGGGGGCNGSAEGTIRSTGAPHGDYTLNPTSCYSGAHEDFFGVWVAPELQSANGHDGWRGGIKLVKNQLNQWDVYIESPIECQNDFDCVVRPLDTSTCSKVEIDVHNTNTTINNIRVREGHVSLECNTPEGGTYSANVSFDGCS